MAAVAAALLPLAPANATSSDTSTGLGNRPGPGLRPATGPQQPYACADNGWPWSCVAQCESDGRWDANTGNGFYGGLQFHQPTWEGFGGREFAARADLATPEQQIEIARRVLAAQGWGAWPVCSAKYGLSGHDSQEAPPGGSVPAQQTAEQPQQTPQPPPAPEPSPAPAAPETPEAPPAPETPPTADTGSGRTHLVTAGDTLYDLAQRYGVPGGWQALHEANREAMPRGPRFLQIGTELIIPAGPA